MVLAWCAVVLAVATVTFVVVDRAGRGVGQASAARTVAPSPSPVSSGPSATSGMPGTPTATASPSSSSGSSSSPGSSTTPQPSAGAERTASFPTAAGTVVATCDGTRLMLGSITVRDGWRFEKEDEKGQLEVKFKTDARDVDDVELLLGGVDGIPTALKA